MKKTETFKLYHAIHGQITVDHNSPIEEFLKNGWGFDLKIKPVESKTAKSKKKAAGE